VTVGQSAAGTTTVNSLTTTITGGGAAGAITIGGSMTGSSIVSIGANCTTNIGTTATRTGFINIGTGGTGPVYVGNTTCIVNSFNLLLDGATMRMPRLYAKGSAVISSIPSGSSNQGIATITIPGGLNAFDLIAIVWNGDQFVQTNMIVASGGVRTDGVVVAQVLNAAPGAARISYAVYAP